MTTPPNHTCFTDEELKSLIRETVQATLLSMGLDHTDPMEYQRDLQFLRDWRKSSVAIKTAVYGTIVTTLISGLIGLVWLALNNKPH